ncbi:MAG: hypothetical protein ACE5I9_04660 [Candidatus Methylomirabilales bacterium]
MAQGLVLTLLSLWMRPGTARHGLVRLAGLGVLALYLGTLGPHLSHHLTATSAEESGCTVLIVTDGAPSGLAEEPPLLIPGLHPGLALPAPSALTIPAGVCSPTQSRAPPLRSG